MKCHSLILRPTLRKSAVVIFRQQSKTFDPKNVLNARFPKCVAHTSGKVEACLWPPFFNALSIKYSENATHDHLVRLYVQQNATSNNSVFNVVFTRQ